MAGCRRADRSARPVGPSPGADYAEGLELDHVLIAVADLEAAGERFATRLGLESRPGGRHPGWGTANRIVPLGSAYLELVSVVDAAEARGSPFGRWVAAMHADHGRPFAWAVRTPDLKGVCRHLGLAASSGSRERPDGSVLRWRAAGLEDAMRCPTLPFFVEWEQIDEHPGRTPVAHPAGSMEIAEVQLRGDAARLAEWLGSQRLPITVHRGAPAVTRVVLRGPTGEIVLREA